MTVGLLFRFETSWRKEDDLARFLEDELSTALGELPVSASFVVRFGPTSFGIFVAYPDEAGQEAHVGDRIATALRDHGADLAETPTVEGFDVLSADLREHDSVTSARSRR
jgi:hypothetical protein